MPTTTREGYKFDGWYKNSNFTGNKVEKLPAEYPAGTTIYYAKWLKMADYTIKYYYQKPLDGTYVPRAPKTDSAVIGTEIDLSEVKPTETPDMGRYVVDDTKGNLSGIVEENGSLVLEVYFALEYKVSGVIDTNGYIDGESEVWVRWGGDLSSLGKKIEFKAKSGYIIESVTIRDVNTTTELVNGKSYTYAGRDNIGRNIEVEAKTKKLNPSLSLAKTVASEPANKTAFVPGETIEYTIVVENNGDQPLNNITVIDSKTGLSETISDDLNPGETKTYNRSYTVKSPVDVEAGKVVNTVTATADVSGEFKDDFIGRVVKADDKEVISSVTESKPSITVEIEAEDKPYERNEIVTYNITVSNNGNATIKEIEVTDTLTGFNWKVGTLVPGGKAFWPITKSTDEKDAKYKVKSADILAGEIFNEVNASGKDPTDALVTAKADKTVKTADIDASYSITKTLDGYDTDKVYKVDETLTYKITVTNEGNVTLENIVVTDQLGNTVGGTVEFKKLGGIPVDDVDVLEAAGLTLNENNTVTITSLEAGNDVVLECEYVITEADAALNTQLKGTDPANAGIRNTVAATADEVIPTAPGKGPVKPDDEKGETGPVNTEARYTLIVQYQYSNGTTANPTYMDYLEAGETYAVYSPTIEGYTSSLAAVTGTMEAKDLVITVVYSVPATTGGGGGGGGGDDTPTTPPTPPIDATLTQPIVIPDIPVPAGAIQVEVPADLVAIGEEEVPLQGARIDIDEDGNVDVTPIDEEEIPLAGIADSPVLHCILHILLMLAAVIIFLYHVVSTQRRQKKLDDLRDQLGEM